MRGCDVMKICPICGKEHNRRKYCSDECRQKRNYLVSKEYQIDYWKNNRERQREIQKSSRERNKDIELERQKQWREENREYEKQRKKEYRKNIKEKYNIPDKKRGKNQKMLKAILEEVLLAKVEEEVYFDFCRNPDTGYIMPVDLYVPSLNLIVEYNGEQHYEPVSFNRWSDTNVVDVMSEFFNRKKMDLLKMNLIINNGYNFLIVPYWEKLSVENLTRLLQSDVINNESYRLRKSS